MECKWWLVVFAVLLIIHAEQTEAARRKKKPKKEEMKCLPGRTVLKFSSKLKSSLADIIHTQGLGGKSDCQFCVCSVDGWDEFCFNRPARNVNECMKVKEAEEYAQSHGPFDHTRSIFHRIRRVGNVLDDKTYECVPFVSEYTDCTEANMCTGCRRCSCGGEGTWDCRQVTECPMEDQESNTYPQAVDNALDMLKAAISVGKHMNIEPAIIKKENIDAQDDLILGYLVTEY